MRTIYGIGDLVYDVDLGIGIVTRIMQDDNDVDGIVYLVWWSRVGQTFVEFALDLTPYEMIDVKERL